MKRYMVTHTSGATCKIDAEDMEDLNEKIASGKYGILPIRSMTRITLTVENVKSVTELASVSAKK